MASPPMHQRFQHPQDLCRNRDKENQECKENRQTAQHGWLNSQAEW